LSEKAGGASRIIVAIAVVAPVLLVLALWLGSDSSDDQPQNLTTVDGE
jgi:hypothetical protein